MRGALLAATVFALASITLLGALPLSIDEILDLITAREATAAQTIARVPLNAGAVPLWYLAEKYTLEITGYSDRKARLPAALFGIATVFTVAFLAAEFGMPHGWLAAALFAILPQALRYSAEARVYSQALFFSTLATLLYVRLAKEATPGRAAAYCLALLAAIYTQPYSGSVALAHLAWSIACREFRTARFGAAALAVAAAAFVPWYLWSKADWQAGIVREGFHFAFSAKTPLMIFREVAGAGYWGSGLLAILCALGIATRRPSPRAQTLLLLLIAVPIASVLAADAAGNYFLAARQFLWVLPAIAILAANAFERRPRAAAVLAVLLFAVCVRQSTLFFTAPRDDWQAAASFLAGQADQGACIEVVPPASIAYYEFFRPDLERAQCQTSSAAPRIVLAIPPTSSTGQREAAVGARKASGYVQGSEGRIGGSAVVLFHRSGF